MRGEVIILVNFPISHFLKSLRHSAMPSETTFTKNITFENGVNLFQITQVSNNAQFTHTIEDYWDLQTNER